MAPATGSNRTATTAHLAPVSSLTSSNGAGNGPAAWVPLEQWSSDTGVAKLNGLTGGSANSCSLYSPRGTLVLRPGSLSARWDGLEVRLGFAPRVIQQQLFVHSLDLHKTIQPLFQPAGASPNRSIVIDPGHGGADCGALSVLGGGCEKYYTLDWAQRLRGLLEDQGWQVSLTRTDDGEVALSNRVAFAAERRASIFLSLHFNSAAPNHTESGVETYCLTPAGMPSSLTRGYLDDTGQAFPNNAYDAENIALAVRIHRSVLRVNGQQDRGVRRARFPTVLRGQQCPAVLIEGGYLSNQHEAQLIADGSYRQKLAEAVARALAPTLSQQ